MDKQQHAAIRCNTLQHAAAHTLSPLLQRDQLGAAVAARHWNMLQHTAPQCKTP